MAVRNASFCVMVAMALLVSGCAGNAGKQPRATSTEPLPLVPPNADYGGIEGFIYDTEVLPLGNATIYILGTNLSAVADEEGYYAFVPLEVGVHHLFVNESNFLEVHRNVTVPAGEGIRADFAMRPIPAPEPYVDAGFSRRGQVHCQFRASVAGTTTNPSCSDSLHQYTYQAMPRNYGTNVTVIPAVEAILIEVQWTQSILTNAKLRVSVQPNEFSTWRQFEGASPIKIPLDPKEMAEFGDFAGRNYTREGGVVYFNVYAGELANQTGVAAGGTFEQDYTLYVTVFYRQPIIEGYSRLPPS